MATDVITRFRLETTQFDSKLRDTAKTLQDIARTAQSGGKNFNDFSKKSIEAARALGTVQSGATNAKDKLKDLVGSFNEAAKAYNSLNETAKKGEFGKALEASLQKLQQDIKQTKEELYGLGDAVKSKSGGLFGNLGDKMGGAMQVFAGNVMTKIAGMGVELAGEMGEMITQGIELAKQGEGIRIAFERLRRGDILDGLRKATHGTVTDLELMKAAVKFNDFKLPLDELATMLSFAQQKAKDTGQSVDYLVESIVNGLGRQSTQILDNLGLSQSEVKRRTAEVGDMTKAVGEIIREQMSAAGDYVETAADRAAQAHVSLQNKMEELGRKFSPLSEASNNFWTSMKIGILDIIGGPLTELLNKLTQVGRMMNTYSQMGGSGKVGRMISNLSEAREGNRQSIYQQQQQQFWRYINPREQQLKDIRAWQSGERGEALQGRINAIREKYGSLDATKIQSEVDAAKKMLSDYQAAAKQILQPIEQKIVPTVVDGSSGGKGGRSGGGSGSKGFDISSIALDQNKAMLAAVKGTGSIEDGYSVAWKLITEGAKESTSAVDELTKAFEALNKAKGDANTGEIAKDGKVVKGSFKDAAGAVGSLGSALSGLDDPGAKIAGTIAQAIANIALAFSSADLKEGESGNIWYWIAATAAGMATMISTIATIHSATGYQNGGVVKGYQRGGVVKGYAGGKPVMGYAGGGSIGSAISGGMITGSTYSNDQIPIMANAGEVVLTNAMTTTLASKLNDQGNTGYMPSHISGEQIYIALNRFMRRSGRGEIVTWKS